MTWPVPKLPAKTDTRGRQLLRHNTFHTNSFGNYERVGGHLAGGAGLVPSEDKPCLHELHPAHPHELHIVSPFPDASPLFEVLPGSGEGCA
jgi:hypothetical protein